MDSSRAPTPRFAELMTRDRWIEIARIVAVGVVILLFYVGRIPLRVLIAGIAVGLYPLVKRGVLDLIREHRIGTEIFVTMATTVAVLGHEYVAGAILLVIILIAEFIAELNTDRARASIKALIGSVPRTAIVRRGDGDHAVPIEELRAGDIVIVRAGEKIPVDGMVKRGAASVDQSSITGESMPEEKSTGAQVFAGTVVDLGALDVEAQRIGADTMFSRIIALVESAEDQQAPVQKLADRVAAWLIPVVLLFLVVVYLVTRDLRMIVTLLIFTSPAELGLATPLVIIAAIARAARSGILVKGGIHLEQLAKVDVIAFDKTGTLTLGEPAIVGIAPAEGVSEGELLRLAAAAERRSSHPLARAVADRARERSIEVPEPSDFEVIRGRGVRATIDGARVVVGNAAMLDEQNILHPAAEAESSTMFVASDGRFLGAIRIADVARPRARASLDLLRQHGIKRIVMLTGDNASVAAVIARELGIDEVFADLLPEQKVAVIEKLRGEGHRVAMVGDGINDAPALAMADVGIAMGVAGTQAAIEAADIALMTNDLGKILEARAIAQRAYRTIQENLIAGVGVVHVAGIAAALLKLIGPVQAAMIHLGPDILVFLNSVKLLRVRIANVDDVGATRR